MSDDQTHEETDTHDELPAITPTALPQIRRLSVEDQDEWSTRMKNRYGGEW